MGKVNMKNMNKLMIDIWLMDEYCLVKLYLINVFNQTHLIMESNAELVWKIFYQFIQKLKFSWLKIKTFF